MKKLYFSTFVEGLEKPIEAMLHKEGGVAVERVLNGAALYRSVREPAPAVYASDVSGALSDEADGQRQRRGSPPARHGRLARPFPL